MHGHAWTLLYLGVSQSLGVSFRGSPYQELHYIPKYIGSPYSGKPNPKGLEGGSSLGTYCLDTEGLGSGVVGGLGL